MITGYRYDLWDGKKIVGEILLFSKIYGKELVISEESILKQSYFKKPKTISFPVIIFQKDYRTWCMGISVKRKSKRQIEILKSNAR